MSHELFYTSAPSGIKPGSKGFCTVACTGGIPAQLIDRLESLSGYRYLYEPGSPQASQNPVSWAHWRVTLQGKMRSVLSRVCDAGSDYSGRSNKFAHHVALEPSELPDCGPAYLMAHEFMEKSWTGSPRMIPAGRSAPSAPRAGGICKYWQKITGDAGWAGVLADNFLADPLKPAYVIYAPGTDILALLEEAMALLPESARWQVTFNTYFTDLPAGLTCAWRGVVAGTPAAREAVKQPGRALVIDLVEAGVCSTQSALVEFARTGIPPVRKERAQVMNEPILKMTDGEPSRRVSFPPLIQPDIELAGVPRSSSQPNLVIVEREVAAVNLNGRRGIPFWIFLLSVCTAALLGGTVAFCILKISSSPNSNETERTRLMTEGAAASKVGDWQKALDVYTKADSIASSRELQAAIASAKEKLADAEKGRYAQFMAEGTAAAQAGKWQYALDSYTKAVAINRTSEVQTAIDEAKKKLEYVQLITDGASSAKTGDWPKALDAYTLAANIDNTLEAKQAIADVRQKIDDAAKSKAELPQLLVDGDTAMNAGDWQRAIDVYEKAAAIDSSPDTKKKLKDARNAEYTRLMKAGEAAANIANWDSALGMFTKAGSIDNTSEVRVALAKAKDEALKPRLKVNLNGKTAPISLELSDIGDQIRMEISIPKVPSPQEGTQVFGVPKVGSIPELQLSFMWERPRFNISIPKLGMPDGQPVASMSLSPDKSLSFVWTNADGDAKNDLVRRQCATILSASSLKIVDATNGKASRTQVFFSMSASDGGEIQVLKPLNSADAYAGSPIKINIPLDGLRLVRETKQIECKWNNDVTTYKVPGHIGYFRCDLGSAGPQEDTEFKLPNRTVALKAKSFHIDFVLIPGKVVGEDSSMQAFFNANDAVEWRISLQNLKDGIDNDFKSWASQIEAAKSDLAKKLQDAKLKDISALEKKIKDNKSTLDPATKAADDANQWLKQLTSAGTNFPESMKAVEECIRELDVIIPEMATMQFNLRLGDAVTVKRFQVDIPACKPSKT